MAREGVIHCSVRGLLQVLAMTTVELNSSGYNFYQIRKIRGKQTNRLKREAFEYANWILRRLEIQTKSCAIDGSLLHRVLVALDAIWLREKSLLERESRRYWRDSRIWANVLSQTVTHSTTMNHSLWSQHSLSGKSAAVNEKPIQFRGDRPVISSNKNGWPNGLQREWEIRWTRSEKTIYSHSLSASDRAK